MTTDGCGRYAKLMIAAREETEYRFEIILYPHRIFQMFEFAASGGALSQKRLHQKRSLFSNCLVVFSGKFKHLKYSVRVQYYFEPVFSFFSSTCFNPISKGVQKYLADSKTIIVNRCSDLILDSTVFTCFRGPGSCKSALNCEIM